MHELGIVFHVIKSVEKIGEENGLTNVASVTLELGETIPPCSLAAPARTAAVKKHGSSRAARST